MLHPCHAKIQLQPAAAAVAAAGATAVIQYAVVGNYYYKQICFQGIGCCTYHLPVQ
jgi:hypothetical protein